MAGISHQQPHHAHKLFLLANYVLIGAAASCVFLTLSLRLLPSPIGALLILLHLLTILLSVSACSSDPSSPKRHVAHMAAAVLAAILQGAVALLVFTRTESFLERMRSYVQEEDGVVILRMAGALGVVMFALEWAVLVVAFVLRFYVHVEGGNGSAKVSHDDDDDDEAAKDWPRPFQA